MAKTFKIIPIVSAAAQASVFAQAPSIAWLEAGRGNRQVVADIMQRPLRDLRISVTDRCNLRCTYCMPREVFDENHPFLPRTELLSFEEIERLANSFIQLGVQKIRLTGGEPLLRRGIERLIESLAKLNTLEGKPVEIALTTNAVLLSKKAQSLKDAGLARVTASLDGLTDETFRRMSDSDVPVNVVLDGIAAAQRVGLAPVKVNMVVKRGVNDHEIIPMAGHFRNSGVVLRFIEFMDVGSTNGWRMDDVVPAREILEQINSRYPILQADPNYTGEVAERWRYADGSGEVGVIASVTQAFCHECTRARLSTDGKLYNCLFASNGADLRGPLRAGATDQMLSNLIAGAWKMRFDRYSQLRHAATGLPPGEKSGEKIEMSYIGG
ncbi:MAG: GTP 3',8-cyclase MoaA [Gallionella sp.]|nr:GTP 3',8-cyclase MoaA [Gallionella sp.]